MNTIGIDHNLNRERIRKLLIIGVIGMWPALIFAAIVGPNSALGGGIGTMFLSFGNLFMFGGLLTSLPDQKRFEQFEASLSLSSGDEAHR